MRIRVGPWTYRVKISEVPIRHAGQNCLGMCRDVSREILISPTCKPTDRLGVLLHEVAHAWIFETGQPSDAEGICDLFETAFLSFNADFASAGGNPALIRLEPGEGPEAKAMTVALTRNRYCPACQGTVAGGSVVCRREDDPTVLSLSLYCPHCNRLQTWRELTSDGLPSGTVVGVPEIVEGEAVRAFLREHPEAVGVD